MFQLLICTLKKYTLYYFSEKITNLKYPEVTIFREKYRVLHKEESKVDWGQCKIEFIFEKYLQ